MTYLGVDQDGNILDRPSAGESYTFKFNPDLVVFDEVHEFELEALELHRDIFAKSFYLTTPVDPTIELRIFDDVYRQHCNRYHLQEDGSRGQAPLA